MRIMEHANDNQPPLDQRVLARSFRLHTNGHVGSAMVLRCFVRQIDQIVWLEEIQHHPPMTLASE